MVEEIKQENKILEDKKLKPFFVDDSKARKPSYINVQKPSKSIFNDEKGKEIKALATVNLAKISSIVSNYKNIPAQRDILPKPTILKDRKKPIKIDVVTSLPSPEANKSLNTSGKLSKKSPSEIKSTIVTKK